MSELVFTYRMHIAFEEPVNQHYFSLKCTPLSNTMQTITDCDVEIKPAEYRSTYNDSLGNAVIVGHNLNPHHAFDVTISGKATTGLSRCISDEGFLSGILYRQQTKLTNPGESIHDLYMDVSSNAPSTGYDRVVYFMNRVYERIQYTKEVTCIQTTAEEALVLGQGVCQDYSHILLSLYRMDGRPARYVVGMLAGEGFSHAWVEAFEGGAWWPVDPTNNVVVESGHIKISHGRDYTDCIINRGKFMSVSPNQHQDIFVSVSEPSKE